jgi:hypothetical protein
MWSWRTRRKRSWTIGNQIARNAARTVQRQDVPPNERNDRWGTPGFIVDSLTRNGEYPFDLDPCGAPQWSLAERTYLLENGDDGLRDPWFGRVWMNPPYGRIMRTWVDRLVEHWEAGGTGTMLIPVATGTKLWIDVVLPKASGIHFWRHRIAFLRRDGREDNMVSPAPSAIVSFGDLDTDLLATSDLPGVFFDMRGQQRV